MEGTGTLPAGLRLAVQRQPTGAAITASGESVTFAELWARSTAFATRLTAEGLSPGDRVAIATDNACQFTSVYFGTLMAGGIAVPLNPAARPAESNVWIQDCEPKFLVLGETSSAFAEAHASHGKRPKLIYSFELKRWYGSEIAGRPLPFPDARQPACIQYTSGSTGNPKGVLLSHRNLFSNATAIVRYLNLTAADIGVTVLPFWYAYGSSVLNTHLLVGASLFFEASMAFPRMVAERIVNEQATGFAGVPSTFALMLARASIADLDFSSLRYITQAGAPMPQSLAKRLAQAFPKTSIFVMYGQTEATSRISYLPPQDYARKAGSVGIPIDGTEVQVRNDQGARCEPGVVGEIWVNGPGVMQCYWHNPQATSDVLVNGWLKTGDVGYLDTDGYLHLSGRRSDIIKVGAHRVNPLDVESVIGEISSVEEVAVVGCDDEVLGQVIRAFVVVRLGETLTTRAIRRHCAERLAPHKVPRDVVFLAALPKTSSGKVKRGELMEAQDT